MASIEAAVDTLDETARHYSDLCPAICRPVVGLLVDRLPAGPASTLSIGCGSGLLEAMLLHAGERYYDKALNIRGVEVSDCAATHLSTDRVLRVPNTLSVHHDVVLASAIMFVYPRQARLVAMYLDAAVGGALEQFVWLGPRSDWPEIEMLLLAAFFHLERVEGPFVAGYELLAIATMPRRTRKQAALT